MGSRLYDALHPKENFAVSPTLGTTPDPLVKTIIYVDPLILDLDGDGLEITPLSKGILFDANGDSIKTGTAWAGADDGMLVWDRDGNGLIDSGRELFGDETILANGQKAAHGFAALSELDTGSVVNGVSVGAADGVFNAKDARYANLRVWRDLNQDGISQAGELQTLAQSGVTSIQLGSSAANTQYGDAILAHSGTFTRANGSTGQAGSFILAQNNFVRQYTPITVSQAAQALPNIGGSGWVRDLQESATLSPELITLFNQAKDAPTRADYKNAVAGLLREWGNDAAYNSASKQALSAGYGLILSDPADAQEVGWMDKAIKASEADRNTYRATLSAADLGKFDAMRERMVGGLEKVHAYEAFTGHTFLNWSQVQGDAINNTPRAFSGGGVPVEVWVPLSQIIHENRNAVLSSQAGYIRVTIPAPPSGAPHIETLWNRLVDDASNNLMPTLRLSKYIDLVDLNIGSDGITCDFSRLNAALTAASTTSVLEGSALVLDLHRTYGSMLDGLGWNGVQQVRSLMQRAVSETPVRDAFAATGIGFFAAGSAAGTESNDAFSGDASANSFSAGAGDDLLDGQAGNDNLSGGAGDDVILGGDGDDALQGNDGADTLDGGSGNDILAGGVYDTWNGNYNGAGNDTYQFGRGDGQDTLIDDDATVGNLDKLVFKTGVAVADVQAVREGDALIIKINGTTDQVRIDSYFSNDGVNNRQVEEIRFTDAPTTVWKLADIKAKVLTGTAGNDTLIGYASADTISGADGNDSLYGRDGADTINGGNGDDGLVGENGNDKLNGDAGDDVLQGGAGNDILNGGSGNDILAGGVYDTWNGNYNGAGNDTYQFGRGDGQDTLIDYDTTAGNVDRLSFKAGVATNQVWLRQVGNNLELSIIGSTDTININNWYADTAYRVERIATSDGKTLLESQVQNLVSAMAGFAPPPAGQTTLTASQASALAPVLAANWQ